MVIEGEELNETVELFLRIGLDERMAKNSQVNAKVTANLTSVIHEAGVANVCEKAVGNLLYMVATKYPANALIHRPILVKHIVNSKINNSTQLEAALSFLEKIGPEKFQVEDFEDACGVGEGGFHMVP